jgi:uncharacterized repeat protein (TIGR03803 family)
MNPILRQLILPMAASFVALAHAGAASFTNLYNFSGTEGAYLDAGLVLSGNTLYGTTWGGGSSGDGTVFQVNPDGTGFTNLYNFSGTNGAYLIAGLMLSGNALYGTTWGGGNGGDGTVFKINANGTGFTNLYNFTATIYNSIAYTNGDGANPYASLVLSGNAMYGTTWVGGSAGKGTVFKIYTDGTGFTNLYNFSGSDGANPYAGLILSGSTLFGTTWGGGNAGDGTVFKVNTNGTGFTNLYNFSGSDGANPYASLVLSGNAMYGTTWVGGSAGKGTMFKIYTDGTGFTNLYNFSGTDGAYLNTGLVLSGNTLYGTTSSGGNDGNGTVFKVNTNGMGFTNLYNFTAAINNSFAYTNSDGANPRGVLVLAGSTLYGTAEKGGRYGFGTVFALTLPPPDLKIQLKNGTVILSWNDSGYLLQAAPIALGIFTNVPGAASPYTNTINSSQRFFRVQAN